MDSVDVYRRRIGFLAPRLDGLHPIKEEYVDTLGGLPAWGDPGGLRKGE
jgi:hypothetical protein